MRFLTLILFLFIFTGTAFSKKPKAGIYRGVLTIDASKGLEVPFNFELKYHKKKPVIVINNADERITVDEITVKKDSFNFKMPVFDTEFRTKLVEDHLEGVWINHYKSTANRMPFKATFGESRRFLYTPGKANPVFEGRWETFFSPGSKDSSRAVALFHHLEQTDYVTGTFLTETGDYRYLEGMRNGTTLYLSTFDGSHAYLFVAELKDGNLQGKFYSGLTWSEPWTAKLNPEAKLRGTDPGRILKSKATQISFSFPDLNGKLVQIGDEKYKNKVVIVQIMGSWCPNCLDESRYFTELYDKFRAEGLEIVALAFERTDDYETARARLVRLKERVGINYDLLVTRLSTKDEAAKAIPGLDRIEAFPTTLILDRQHYVALVHSGFSGPATGEDYLLYKQETEAMIRQLLK